MQKHGVTLYYNEITQSVELRKNTENGHYIVIASFPFGSGYGTYEMGDEDMAKTIGCTEDELDKYIEMAEKEAKKYPAKVNAALQEKIYRLIALNAKRDKLAKELTNSLNAMYDTGIEENAYGYSPLAELSTNNIVSGEVKVNSRGKKYLKTEDAPAAEENGFEGYYVHQVQGYCEDDYSGEQYLNLGDGKYLKIYFDM